MAASLVEGVIAMAEYLVDFEGESSRYSSGTPKPDEEPHTHYFKQPLAVRFALVCNLRAAEGWRLVSTEGWIGSGAQTSWTRGFYLFIER